MTIPEMLPVEKIERAKGVNEGIDYALALLTPAVREIVSAYNEALDEAAGKETDPGYTKACGRVSGLATAIFWLCGFHPHGKVETVV
jgi:hypothetical protein